MTPRRFAVVAVGACLVVAVASLALPAALTFDPWAWMVWGREIGRFELDTTGSPSWKPFPALLATPLAPLGTDLGPTAWLVVTRTLALLGVVGVARLAGRLAGGVAAVVAAGLVLLTPDGDPRFLRLVAEGHVAPLALTFAVWAAVFHLAGRRRGALGLGWCAALIRPETWPLLGLYALWLWWRDPASRAVVAVVLVSIPLLWFGGDWLGSGDAWHGADVARVGADDPIGTRAVDALSVAAAMVPAPAWFFAVVGVETARRRGDHRVLVLAAGALVWAFVVVAMAVVLGYAALGRFFLPAAGSLCVLAGVGVVRTVGVLRDTRATAAVAAVVLLVAGVALVPRAVGIEEVLDDVVDRGRLEDDLDLVLDRAGGADAILACGPPAVSSSGLLRPAVAWKLDLALHDVRRVRDDHRGAVVVRADTGSEADVAERGDVVELARTAEWVVFRVEC